MQFQNSTDNDDTPPDPGNLRDSIDEAVIVHTDHTAIDGGGHVLPEDIERHKADRVYRDLQASIDEGNQPERGVQL